MRWPWRPRRPIEPRQMVGGKAMELQTAKEILAEVFGARPGEVEEMIQRRLEERSWPEEVEAWQKEQVREEGRWPATFCLGDLTTGSRLLSIQAWSPPIIEPIGHCDHRSF
jgi:hypothetical protein